MKHIVVRITPNAKTTEIKGKTVDNIWRISVASPPADGKANKELIRFLAKMLEVSPSEISIRRGHGAKTKTLEVPDDVSLSDLV